MVKKIIVIDSTWDMKSATLQYALKASKGTDTDIAGIFLTADGAQETIDKAGTVLDSVKQEFSSEGVGFSSHVAVPEAGAFMKIIDSLTPASLVLIGEANFTAEMKKGGAGIEALKEKLTCPVTTAEDLVSAQAENKPAKGTNWGMWILYAIGSVLLYGVFFPRIESLNEKLFMSGTVLGGIAIMIAVVIHAWIWGNTTHILPKLFKLEK
jgi:hypothetical protein